MGKGVFAGVGVFSGGLSRPVGVIVRVKGVLTVFIETASVLVQLCICLIAGGVVSQEVLDLFLFFHQQII